MTTISNKFQILYHNFACIRCIKLYCFLHRINTLHYNQCIQYCFHINEVSITDINYLYFYHNISNTQCYFCILHKIICKVNSCYLQETFLSGNLFCISHLIKYSFQNTPYIRLGHMLCIHHYIIYKFENYHSLKSNLNHIDYYSEKDVDINLLNNYSHINFILFYQSFSFLHSIRFLLEKWASHLKMFPTSY